VTTAIVISRATLRIVRQNLAWAIVYNATALPLAALGFVPPWAAAIGMSASSLIVVLNALRINRFGAS
jgi:Cu2+-exporting ATPase